MRITSGAFRGRILQSPEGLATRPTSDRARQAVFNILLHANWGGPDLLDGQPVMDVFAGTGALGLEALSRGAGHAAFIEESRGALQALRTNITACRCDDRAQVMPVSALSPPTRPASVAARQIVFFDPPYNTQETSPDLGRQAITALDRAGWLAPSCLLVMEMAKKFPEATPDGATLLDERHYGVALVRFLRWRD